MIKGVAPITLTILVIVVVFVVAVSLSNLSTSGTQYSQIIGGVGLGKCVAASPSVTLSPSSQSGNAGSTLSYVVGVKNNDGGNSCKSSSFSLTGIVPSGWSHVFGSSFLTVSPGSTATTTFRVSSSPSAVPGTYTVSASAAKTNSVQSGIGSASYIIPQPSQTQTFDFSISFNPTSATVKSVNGTARSTVTVSLVGGSGTTESVSLSISGCPQNTYCYISPNLGNPTFSTTLNIFTGTGSPAVANSSTPTGTYTITVTGTSSKLIRFANFILTVV